MKYDRQEFISKSYKKRMKYLVWIVSFLIASIFMIFPLIIMVLTSFKADGDLFSFLPKVWKFSNYTDVLSQGNWAVYFKNSIIITVIAVIASLLLNSMAGFAFARLSFRGKEILFTLIILGMIMPAQVTLLPTFLTIVHFPLVGGNNLLGQGGSGFYNTYVGVLMPLISGSFGIFFCRQFFIRFPKSLDEAARIDGVSTWQLYWKIHVPNAKPLFATLGLLKFVSTWNDYLWTLVMVSSDEMKTVQLGLTRFQTEDSIYWGLTMAATTLVALPVMVVFLFAQKHFIEGTVTSGIK